MAEFRNFRLDREGVAQVCRSGAVMDALGGIAAPIARACNAEAVPQICELCHVAPGEIETRPYQHGVKCLSRTAIGYVNVRGLGKINEAVNHTLSKRNH